jgi:hypothetical protein
MCGSAVGAEAGSIHGASFSSPIRSQHDTRSALRDLREVLYHKFDRKRTRRVWWTLERDSIAANRLNRHDPRGAGAA